MDRSHLSEAIIHELTTVFVDEMRALAAEDVQGDLETIERSLQQMSRRVYGRVVSALLRVRSDETARPEACGACGGPVRLTGKERVRQARGLVGDVQIVRAAYVCSVCHQGIIPLDTVLGMGPWGVTPGLARVVALAGSTDSFADASESIAETLGVPIPVETVRALSEAVGASAEADQQDRIVAVRTGTVHETTGGVDTLLVEVDGVQVPHRTGWHEMKIGRVAPLGPEGATDAQTGRTTLRLGASVCGGGLDGADDFWARVQMLALQAGLGDDTRRVVVLCDGAAWIWNRAATLLAAPQRAVIEIVDIFHAYEHLWAVGHALYPETAACAQWVEPLKDALYAQGASAVIAALAAVHPPSPESGEMVRTTRAYFTTHAARMDYPRFVAQHLPIGSGAIESLCKNLVAERAKGAGMRWSGAGVQSIITLRALHRSGDWTAFWARHPLTAYARRWPRKQRPRRLVPVDASSPPPIRGDPPRPPTPERSPARPAQPSPWRRGPGVIPKCA